MEIGLIGTSYKIIPISQMEPFYFAQDGLSELLNEIRNSPILEIVPLLTCNRMEYYIVAESFSDAIDWLHREVSVRKEQPIDDVRRALTVSRGLDAIMHLFSVASGLESMVFGENEILTQIKTAYSHAYNRGLTQTILNKLFQSAVSCGKRVRTETAISRGAYSVSSIAIDALRTEFMDYFGRRILVIGAGSMGRRCVKKLHDLGHPDITLVNRTMDKAQQLADDLSISVSSFDSLSEYASTFDIIITAVSRKLPILEANDFSTDSKTVMVIDLGLPRNVHSNVASDSRMLVSVEGLKSLAEKNINRRKGEVAAVKMIIEDEIVRYQKWMSYKNETVA